MLTVGEARGQIGMWVWIGMWNFGRTFGPGPVSKKKGFLRASAGRVLLLAPGGSALGSYFLGA